MSNQVSFSRFAVVVFALLTALDSPGLQAGETGTAVEQASAGDNKVEQVDYPAIATRIVDAMRLYAAKYNMTPAEMAQKAEGLATRLGMSLVRAGGEADGPLHILAESGQPASNQRQELLLALPSRGNPRPGGRYRAINTPRFHCSYLSYTGPADGIAAAWARLIKATRDAGYETNGQARYVFACNGRCSKEQIFVELQLGIQ